MKTINELIDDYRAEALRIRERISVVSAEMKQQEDRLAVKEYRKRIETLYEEYGDIMYAINLMLPYREEESRERVSGDC